LPLESVGGDGALNVRRGVGRDVGNGTDGGTIVGFIDVVVAVGTVEGEPTDDEGKFDCLDGKYDFKIGILEAELFEGIDELNVGSPLKTR